MDGMPVRRLTAGVIIAYNSPRVFEYFKETQQQQGDFDQLSGEFYRWIMGLLVTGDDTSTRDRVIRDFKRIKAREELNHATLAAVILSAVGDPPEPMKSLQDMAIGEPRRHELVPPDLDISFSEAPKKDPAQEKRKSPRREFYREAFKDD